MYVGRATNTEARIEGKSHTSRSQLSTVLSLNSKLAVLLSQSTLLSTSWSEPGQCLAMPRRRSTGRSSRSHQARNVPIEPELPQQKWEGVVEAFRDLVTEAEVSGVNPAACIPFTNIRIISNSGVARLKESFSGKCNHDSPTTGMTSGGCLPSVVRLQGVYDSYPLNYWRLKLQEDGLEDSQIDEKLNEKMEENNTWYGIVDGAHRHRALVELIAEDAITWPPHRTKT